MGRLHLRSCRALRPFTRPSRPPPWAVTDAPEVYIKAQLRSIVGIRMRIVSLQGKRKMSQNRPESDRNGVKQGLGDSRSHTDQIVSDMISI
ncbi:transcriptional regulator [Rhizobium tibeticum]|uniref:Transcriptional regulator n=1 Tax=Rhizobium tibeticum TaxID=501024 RepID=A0A1H8VTF8_9HYPH|nr:hypothetical protein RTCCBAU85039_6210 [Rhizobium tibeticum]SEP18686.1 transcriptional regulator [Rhizobium tibeticum]